MNIEKKSSGILEKDTRPLFCDGHFLWKPFVNHPTVCRALVSQITIQCGLVLGSVSYTLSYLYIAPTLESKGSHCLGNHARWNK